MEFFELLLQPVLLKLILKALIVGALVSLCSSLLGVNLVLKRFSMIGDGLSHVGFGALAVAAVLKLNDFKMEISIPIVILAAFLILRIRDSGKIKGDAAVAVISTGAIAIGSIIYNFSGSRNTDVCDSLFGSSSVLTLTDKDFVISIVLSVIVLVTFVFFYNKIFAITFDEGFARATGVKSDLYTVVISVLTAVTIVVGMEMMGVIMISGLIVFPSLSAMRIFKSFRSVTVASAVISLICFVVGFYCAIELSYVFDGVSFQTGPMVVAAHMLCFISFTVAAKIAGKLRTKKRLSE